MSIIKNNQKVRSVLKGSQSISKIYKGTALVFQKNQVIVESPLKLTKHNFEFGLIKVGNLGSTPEPITDQVVTITSKYPWTATFVNTGYAEPEKWYFIDKMSGGAGTSTLSMYVSPSYSTETLPSKTRNGKIIIEDTQGNQAIIEVRCYNTLV